MRSALVTAASTSMTGVATGGESIGSIFTFQVSRWVVSKISMRSRSSTCFTVVSAMISCSWSAATSACADTRSSGGERADVHLGLVHARQLLREFEGRLARFDVGARPPPAPSTTDFVFATVCTVLSRRRVSAMSRFVRLVASCCRAESMKRSRTSGCDTLTDRPD